MYGPYVRVVRIGLKVHKFFSGTGSPRWSRKKGSKTVVCVCDVLPTYQMPQVALRVGNDSVMPASSVRDLGIYIDSDASMKTHILRTVSFVVLRQIRSIRQSVS